MLVLLAAGVGMGGSDPSSQPVVVPMLPLTGAGQ